MLTPRHWPTGVWVAAIAVGVLVLHGIGLAIHLLVAGPHAESYSEHVAGGFAPGLVVLGVGVGVAISTTRLGDDEVAAVGRALLLALIAVALGLLALGLQLY